MFTLDEVVPWWPSFDEYVRMFALTDEDLRPWMLGCADGPAGGNQMLRITQENRSERRDNDKGCDRWANEMPPR